jgi:hypothetical protein
MSIGSQPRGPHDHAPAQRELKPAERRAHARFSVQPFYSPLRVRGLNETGEPVEGFIYDVSMGGLRFEADRAFAPGTPVDLHITLPLMHAPGGRRTLEARASVVWIEDEDDPPPYKMAAVFTGFADPADEQRLRQQLNAGRYQRAA